MSKTPKDLLDYADIISAKYPTVSKDIVLEIINNIPPKINTKEYETAYTVQQRLGLSSGYFSDALRKAVEIKADIVKQGSFLYVKLDCEIKRLLDEEYICCKISKEESDSFDYAIALTKNTLLGFYK